MAATGLDRALRTLSSSANKGRLWYAVAAIGFLAGGRARRGAIRGIGALAATSFLTNVLLKPATRRRRPALERTPVFRRLHRPPRTTSFPSGHAASAAAFATGMTLENPVFGASIAPLAATVGYSRVHVGVHYVSDVVAGAALGAGIALATQWWWPVRPSEPTRVREHVPAATVSEGRGLVLVVNQRSGPDDGAAHLVTDQLPYADVVELVSDVDLDAELARRAADALAFGAVGGDGTIAAVAGAALRHARPLAVFPTGTFNHFARDVGIEVHEDTLAALAAGEAVAVDVAAVNGIPFLNTAVLGAYPELVRRRDQLAGRIGKHPAMAVAAGQVLRHQTPMRLLLDGKPVAAWMVFVGNGAYRARGALPAWRPRLDDGWLDVKYLRADTPFSRTHTVLSTFAGVAERNGVYHAQLATELQVESVSGPVPFARDGEAEEPASSFPVRQAPRHPGGLPAADPAARSAPAEVTDAAAQRPGGSSSPAASAASASSLVACTVWSGCSGGPYTV